METEISTLVVNAALYSSIVAAGLLAALCGLGSLLSKDADRASRRR